MNNEAELLLLKKQYDIDYLQHWRRPDGTSKYNTISVDELNQFQQIVDTVDCSIY